MKIQTNAVNVLERTSNYLNSGVLKTPPAWFNVVAKHPPRKQSIGKGYIRQEQL